MDRKILSSRVSTSTGTSDSSSKTLLWGFLHRFQVKTPNEEAVYPLVLLRSNKQPSRHTPNNKKTQQSAADGVPEMGGRRTTTLSCVAEQGNNASDVGDNGIKVSSRERQKETQRTGVTPPGLYPCVPRQERSNTHHCTSSFSFFPLFLGHSCDKEKVVVQTIWRASFSFFWGEGGGEAGGKPGSIHVPKSPRGKKT